MGLTNMDGTPYHPPTNMDGTPYQAGNTIQASPYQDPAYLAFLRSQGIQEANLGAEAKARISSLHRALNLRMGGYADQEKRGLQNASDDFEGRGLFRSGGRLVAQQHVANDVARARLGDVASTEDQIANSNLDLATQLANLRANGAEAQLQARAGLSGAGY